MVTFTHYHFCSNLFKLNASAICIILMITIQRDGKKKVSLLVFKIF